MGTLNRFATLAEFPTPAQYINNYVLEAGVAQTVTFPVGALLASFSAGAPFFVRWDGEAAVVPGANVTDGTGGEYSPTVRLVRGVSSCSVIASAATTLSVSLWGES